METANTFILSAADSKILRELFTQYTKVDHPNQEGDMQFHEFFQLSLEKGLVSNKFNFAVYLESFLSVAGEDGRLPYERFPSLLTLIATKLIPGQKKPINILINDYLGDKTVAVDNRSSFSSPS